MPTRRGFLRLMVGGETAGRDTLVVVFLRGGADGLTLVPPHGDPHYYSARPSLAVSRPDHRGATDGTRAADLDGQFGLAPALAPLLPFWREGVLGAVHAVGSDDSTRSHFEAQDLMEHGLCETRGGAGVGGGWVARHLLNRAGRTPTALAAVALGPTLPEALRGAPAATAFESLDEFQVTGDAGESSRVMPVLERLYGSGDDPLARAGRETIEVLRTVERLRGTPYAPLHGATYPETDLGRSLREVARLTRAEIGLEVACVDVGGWDTHFVQGSVLGGVLAGRMEELAGGLAAFLGDMHDRLDRLTVVVMTEFGRRVAENTSLGTDHGRGGAMFVAGGHIAGGKVHGTWPGLAPEKLATEGGTPLDLQVTTDYRDVLGEILATRCGQERLERVFPGLTHAPLGLVRA